MRVEKLSDGTPLEEGMKFKLLNFARQFSDIEDMDTLTVVKNENYPHLSTQEWLFLDENGVDHSEEWYFYNGDFLVKVI